MSENPFHHDSGLSVPGTHPHSHQLSHSLQHGHSHSHHLSLPHPHSLPLPPPPPSSHGHGHGHGHGLTHAHVHPHSQHHGHVHGHNDPGLGHHSVDGHQPPGTDMSVASALRQMSEPDAYSEMLHMPISKRLVDEVLASTTSQFDVDLASDGSSSPDRKRRKTNGEQQIKRHKYDVLKAFFRLYFEVDKDSMVLKDAIYNLYARKISSEARIARNAMYRHMRSFFKDKTTTFQSNYREYVKGIKLVMTQNQLNYEGSEKDIELLTSIGVGDLFDFHEEELAKTDKSGTDSKYALSSQYMSSEESLMNYIEQIEQAHRNLGNMLKELKARIKKKT